MPEIYNTVSILGLGLIGGAVGMRVKKNGAAAHVTALVRRLEVVELAIHLKAADTVTLDPRESVENADLVILATSVGTIPDILETVKPYLKSGCTVTDVGSTKSRLLTRCQKILTDRPDVHLVGSHPLSGTENRGLLNSEGVVLTDHLCIITPIPGVPESVNDRIKSFWEALGMTIMVMDPVHHDQTLAFASHVPHYVASSLMAIQTDESMLLSAGGLRDTTRIAHSDPNLWSEIAMENSTAIAAGIRDVIAELDKAAAWMEHGEKDALERWFRENRDKRERGLMSR